MSAPVASFVASGVAILTPPDGQSAGDGASDWFDYRRELGPRGYKYLPAASQYLLAATKRALADSGVNRENAEPERWAAAVGTNCAASNLHADMDRTVLDTDAGDLSPALAPFFSINLFGSRLAIEHQLKAFNLTLTSPRVAGIEALQHGLRLARLGRTSWLIAGAAEAALDDAEPGSKSSETGAVAVVLEPADAVTALPGGRSYGRCQAWTAFLPPAQADTGRAAKLILAASRALALPSGARVGVRAVLDDSRVGDALSCALGAWAIGDSVQRLAARAGCLEPMVQVARALTEASDTDTDGVLVVTAAAEGNVAFALITK
jgi:3-oxoacyl-[acyl-carrier-protein] synthase II